jgi:hypothetical protein
MCLFLITFASFISLMESHSDSVEPSVSTWWFAQKFYQFRKRRQTLAKRLTSNPQSLAVRIVMPFSYATVGGIMGGLTVMFAKSSAQILALTLKLQSPALFLQFFTYFALLAMAVTSVGQVTFAQQWAL